MLSQEKRRSNLEDTWKISKQVLRAKWCMYGVVVDLPWILLVWISCKVLFQVMMEVRLMVKLIVMLPKSCLSALVKDIHISNIYKPQITNYLIAFSVYQLNFLFSISYFSIFCFPFSVTCRELYGAVSCVGSWSTPLLGRTYCMEKSWITTRWYVVTSYWLFSIPRFLLNQSCQFKLKVHQKRGQSVILQ